MKKKPYFIMSSVALISLTSCTQNNNSNNEEKLNTTPYISTRTISDEETILKLDKEKYKDLGSSDYTDGISEYPVIQNIKLDETENISKEEELFTLEEVQKIADILSKEYDDYLNKNIEYISKEYEDYINSLTKDYTVLQEEYFKILDELSNYMYNDNIGNNNQENNNVDPNDNVNNNINNDNKENIDNQNNGNQEDIKNDDDIDDSINDENKDTTENNKIDLSREENLDLIYEKALNDAANNIDEFEPIQGIK